MATVNNCTYVGSGPYCYANALAMMLGSGAPSPAVIEFATSSPFGMEFVGRELVLFDPYGWDPSTSFDAALEAAGWLSTLTVGKNADDALARLKHELGQGRPVFVGPVEMGYLRYQPGMRGPIGADHYVVVLGINGDEVELHDPHGHPHATLPVADLMAAWRAESIAYGRPYMMRSDFRQIEHVSEEDVIRRSLANARRWLSLCGGSGDMPPESVANGDAAERLAVMVEVGVGAHMRSHLVSFAIRVGARRLADAATCLSRVGHHGAAEIMAKQAQLVGSLQHPLVVGDGARAATALRRLAPTYEELRAALDEDS